MIVYHLPMLEIADGASATVLDGEVRRFLFDEFAELDSDWAAANYFVKGSAVWVTEGTFADMDRDDELLRTAELIRLATSAVLEAPLPSPHLSIRYFGLGEKKRGRRIGAFDRTLLLHDHHVATAGTETLQRIAGLVAAWRTAGYEADHPAFSALDAFGAVYTSLNARPELRMMPTMVALEGIFASANEPGIARRMSTTLSGLLTDETALTSSLGRLYRIRSDIIHGRSLDDAAMETMDIVGPLACRATLALMAKLVSLQILPDKWTDILEPRT